MTGRDPDLSPERVRALYEARALAEIAAADALAPGSDVIAWSGELLADVALVKGFAGPAEAAGGRALSGNDGEAAAKALEALGWPPSCWFATLSRPEPTIPPEARAQRLRLQVEAVDPAVVIALDAKAAEDVAAAFALDEGLGFGQARRAAGRTLVAVDGLEESLGDPNRKRRVWSQLKAAAPPGPVY